MRSTRSWSRSARDHALLVAGELEVDVELDVGERVGLQVLEALVEAWGRRRWCARGRGRGSAACRGRRATWRAGRRTRSCRRPPPARRRTTRACCRARSGRRPCGRPASALTSGAPEGRAVVLPLAARLDARAAAGAGAAGLVVDLRAARALPERGPTPACAGGRRRRSRSPPRRSCRRCGATGRSAPPSRPPPSTGCRCRRRSAGRARRRRSGAWGRPRGGGGGSARSRTVAPRMSGPRPAIRWSMRVRESVISSSTGPLNWTTALPPRRIESQAAREGRRSASSTRQEPVMRRCEWIVRSLAKRMNRCLPCASTLRTGWPCRRSGQRSRLKRGCSVSSASGTWPSRIGRIRFAA